MCSGRIVGAVFARGGSKEVPRKNLRQLAGRPLLAHSLDALRQVQSLWRLVVSTDDAEIASVARNCGAEIVDRPAELATDESPEWLAWQHLVEAIGGGWGDRSDDVLLSAPTTSPLRAPEDLERAVARLHEGDFDGVISVTPASRNPYFNMVTVDETGQIAVVAVPPTPVFRRQDAPVVYDVTTVAYAVRACFIRAAPRLYSGRIGAIMVPPQRALDIDSEMELLFAEVLLARGAVAAGRPDR